MVNEAGVYAIDCGNYAGMNSNAYGYALRVGSLSLREGSCQSTIISKYRALHGYSLENSQNYSASLTIKTTEAMADSAVSFNKYMNIYGSVDIQTAADVAVTCGDVFYGWRKIGGKVYYFRASTSNPAYVIISDAERQLTYNGVRSTYYINQTTVTGTGADYYITNPPQGFN